MKAKAKRNSRVICAVAFLIGVLLGLLLAACILGLGLWQMLTSWRRKSGTVRASQQSNAAQPTLEHPELEIPLPSANSQPSDGFNGGGGGDSDGGGASRTV